MGKTLGTDLATGKLTLPALLLRDKLGINEFQGLFRQLQAGDAQAGREALSGKMDECSVFPDVEEYFARELQAARTGLERSNASGYSRGLLERLLVFLEAEFSGLVRG